MGDYCHFHGVKLYSGFALFSAWHACRLTQPISIRPIVLEMSGLTFL
jgi:hypothetical protein